MRPDAIRRRGAWLAAAMVAMVATPARAAESGVTLYGLFDTSIEITNNGATTTPRLDSGSARGSRFGVRGSEEIGAGTQIDFALENGFGSDDGTYSVPGTLFNRQAWLGASGPWGQVRMGRQYSPLYIPVKGKLDAFSAGTIASGLNNFSTITPYINNAITYFTPVFGGLHGTLMLGVRDDTIESRSVINNTHVVIGYNSGPFDVVAAGQQVRDASGSGTFRAGYVGGSYQLGALQLFGGFYAGRHSGNTIHKEVYTLSGLYQLGAAGAFSLGYARVNDHAGGGNADQFSAMYRYSLSKRTELYLTVARLNNHHRAVYTLRGVNVAGIPPAFPGADMTGGQFGVLHRF